MRYEDVEKSLELNNLSDIELDYIETFERVDEIADLLKNNQVDNPNDIKTVVTELAGIFMSLTSVSKLFVEYKKLNELTKYMKLKETAINDGEKFVAISAEREARLFVTDFAKLRDRFESYIKSCDITIRLLQSLLAYSRTELSKGMNE